MHKQTHIEWTEIKKKELNLKNVNKHSIYTEKSWKKCSRILSEVIF